MGLSKLLFFFFLVFLYENQVFAQSCRSLLGNEYRVGDNFNTYAVGPVVDGVQRVHVIEHEGFIQNPSKWTKRASEIVLERENFNLPHKPLKVLDDRFVVTVSKTPIATRAEFEGRDGKQRTRGFMREYLQSFDIMVAGRFKKIKDFAYERKEGSKMLFMVEVHKPGKIIELVFTVRTPVRDHEGNAAQYGAYLLQKIGVSGVISSVRMYGGGFD